jgi:hypothetical protein
MAQQRRLIQQLKFKTEEELQAILKRRPGLKPIIKLILEERNK